MDDILRKADIVNWKTISSSTNNGKIRDRNKAVFTKWIWHFLDAL